MFQDLTNALFFLSGGKTINSTISNMVSFFAGRYCRSSSWIKMKCDTFYFLLQYEASIVMLDDFLDNSYLRNQQLCWYSLPNVGKKAAVHAVFVENCTYFLLQKHFSMHPQYTNFLHIFLTAPFYTNYGQCLDLLQYSEKNMTVEYLNASNFGRFVYGGYYT